MATENKISSVIEKIEAISLKPKIRFKEFEGYWEERKLVSEINFIAGYAFKSFEMKNIDSKYQLIKMSNVYKSELQLNRNPSYWGEIDSKIEKYLLKKKDILLTLTGTVGKQDYGYSIVIPINNRFLLNQRLVCLRAKPNRSDSDFINNLIKTTRFYYFFFGESKGGTGNQTNVGIDDLRNIKLNFPKLSEQQKIATFLTAVDTKLQQLNSKKSTLETYKKGVMQQLFSQKIRFKADDGSDFEDWEEKKLGEFAYITTGTSNRIDSSLDGEYTFFDRSEDIRTSHIYLFDAEAIIVPGEGQKFTPKYFIGKFDLHQRSYAIMNFENTHGKFIFYHISFYTNYLLSQAVGSTVKSLRLPMFKKMNIKLPIIKEQQKIANYISAIDVKIENVHQQIKKTKAFKKGLLQQMFI